MKNFWAEWGALNQVPLFAYTTGHKQGFETQSVPLNYAMKIRYFLFITFFLIASTFNL
jgi:hypothetical protein